MKSHCEKIFLLKNLPRAEALRGLADFCPSGANEKTIAAVAAYNTLLETSSSLLHHLNNILAGQGLTQARFRTLFVAYTTGGEKGISPCELADIIKVERATITSLIDGLERDGLVRREPAPNDRRSIKVHLTQKGKGLIKTFTPKRMRYMMDLMGALSTQECKALVKMLEKMEKRLGEMEGQIYE